MSGVLTRLAESLSRAVIDWRIRRRAAGDPLARRTRSLRSCSGAAIMRSTILMATAPFAAARRSWYAAPKGTYLTTRRRGASLVLGPFPKSLDQAVLVAVGPGNGKVRVDSRCGKEWRFNRTLNLHASKNRTLVKRWVNRRWECPGGLRITVISEGKPVRIDGAYAPPRDTPSR